MKAKAEPNLEYKPIFALEELRHPIRYFHLSTLNLHVSSIFKIKIGCRSIIM